jgi:hypothetical protein
MAYPRTEDISAAIRNLLLAKLESITDVAELYVQSPSPTYPCARYSFVLEPIDREHYRVLVSVYFWSASDSSIDLRAIIDRLLSTIPLVRRDDGVLLQTFVVESTPRIARQQDAWRGEIAIRCDASAR